MGGYGDDSNGHMDPLGGFSETEGDVSTGYPPWNTDTLTPL